MITRRRLLCGAAVSVVATATMSDSAARAAVDPPTVATIRSFCDALLSAMKDGPVLGFTGRRDQLAPAIRSTFDLPLMTRLMVGPQWTSLTADQQQHLIDAFSAFSIATYASRFDDYDGEQFDVDGTPAALGGTADVIVRTKLVQGNGQAVQLDYLMRSRAGEWQAIDVYLSGTISELATRRAEFSSVLRQHGPEALVDILQRRTASLSG
jgi:phospholipid transport system substrate-binding protein